MNMEREREREREKGDHENDNTPSNGDKLIASMRSHTLAFS